MIETVESPFRVREFVQAGDAGDIQERLSLVDSLIGILPADITLEDAREEQRRQLENIFRSNPDLVREYQQREQDKLDYRLSLEAREKRGEERAQRTIMERLIAGGISPQQAAAFTGLTI